jgi:hypothetical protein
MVSGMSVVVMLGRLASVGRPMIPTVLAAFVAQGIALAITTNIIASFFLQLGAGLGVGRLIQGRWAAAMLGACSSGTVVMCWIGYDEFVIALIIGVLFALCFFTPGYLIGAANRSWAQSDPVQATRTVATPLSAGAEPARPTVDAPVAPSAYRTGPVATGGKSPGARAKVGVALLILGAQALIIMWIYWTISRAGP